ncbi:MAG: nuclear transport factor 2 family protein, partial [Novosphingobium sp.]
AKAISCLDIPKVMTFYVDNDSLVLFDQMTPRQYVGRQAMIDIWNDFLENKVKSLDSYSCSGVKMWVAESGDLAGGLLFHTSDLTLLDGSKMHVVLRLTHVLVKQNGRWVIQHEHGSFPINWETGEPDYLSKE